MRSEAFQLLLDAAQSAFAECATIPEARLMLGKVRHALETPGEQAGDERQRQAACSFLPAVLGRHTAHEALALLMERFRSIEPELKWRQRASDAATASPNFTEGHANAMIVGPHGLERRSDIAIGVSLLAPHVRYPDHHHAPEEVYLVLSDGEFRQDDGSWFTPGFGGSFYNVPNIRHAMRSLDTPLFAFWILNNT